jgi:hypothetical protein
MVLSDHITERVKVIETGAHQRVIAAEAEA